MPITVPIGERNMRKKAKKSILTLHKEIQHNAKGATINKDVATLSDETQYKIDSKGTWRKICK